MGRAGRWILISVVALLVLLVAADRVGAAVAERAAADTLQSSQGLRSRPDVNIAGFPFLTQLAAGEYDKITVTAQGVPLGDNARGLELSRLEVVLHHLSVSRSFSHFHADTASATGTIGLDQLGAALGAHLDYAGNGRVGLTRDLTVARHTVHVRVTAKPYLHDGSLRFTDTSVIGADGASGPAIDALARLFEIDIPLRSIPFDIRLTSLSAGENGLTLNLVGRDLVYTR